MVLLKNVPFYNEYFIYFFVTQCSLTSVFVFKPFFFRIQKLNLIVFINLIYFISISQELI